MIDHTENETTLTIGQSTVTMICDSISPKGARISTLELVYPRYIHCELLAHRIFSRNAASSRATPVNVTLHEVRNDPVFFDYVGCNQRGMVAGEAINESDLAAFQQEWFELAAYVANKAESWASRYNIHKQNINRVLEPWLRIRTLVTGTEWDNFFNLRCSKLAQPETHSLAMAIQSVMNASTPVCRNLHLPYITSDELSHLDEMDMEPAVKCSVARCARISYARMDGKKTTIDEDLALHDRLLEAGHMSPFEHVAAAQKSKTFYDNFVGWASCRYMLKIIGRKKGCF